MINLIKKLNNHLLH